MKSVKKTFCNSDCNCFWIWAYLTFFLSLSLNLSQKKKNEFLKKEKCRISLFNQFSVLANYPPTNLPLNQFSAKASPPSGHSLQESLGIIFLWESSPSSQESSPSSRNRLLLLGNRLLPQGILHHGISILHGISIPHGVSILRESLSTQWECPSSMGTFVLTQNLPSPWESSFSMGISILHGNLRPPS